MKVLRVLPAFLLLYAGLTSSAMAQTLFKLDGKNFSTQDLPPSDQQSFFEAETEHFERIKGAVDNAILNLYFTEEAKKKGKTVAELEQKEFEIKEPNEKEMKEWFEKNKARIPYTFDQIKNDIGRFLKSEKMQQKRQELVQKIKNQRKFELLVTRPEAPTVKVALEGFPAKGPNDAKVTLVEFADYQCPHCKAAAPVIKDVVKKYKDKVKVVFVDYPINPSGISRSVAEGSHCAGEQNNFWEYHYLAFDKQSTLDKEAPVKLAQELKLDEKTFKSCLSAGKAAAVVEKGKKEGERIGVSGTPFILINGRRYLGAHSTEALSKEIDEALKKGV